jgi:hypothetical protein
VSWPEPRPGLVIRYSYLWQREHDAGREEGVKDRPCAVILAVLTESGEHEVYVLPLTHTPPFDPADGVELPQATRARLNLDGERSWIVVTEGNRFLWPGPDLRRRPGKGPDDTAYGMLPPAVFQVVKARFFARVRARRAGMVSRTS